MTATTLQPAPQETSAAAVSGLVELADGHAFVRASGYRRGPADVYVSAAQIRQYGLRTGDWVLGGAQALRAAASTARWPGSIRSTASRPAWPARTSTS